MAGCPVGRAPGQRIEGMAARAERLPVMGLGLAFAADIKRIGRGFHGPGEPLAGGDAVAA